MLRNWDASPDSQLSDRGGISTQAWGIVLGHCFEEKKELISEDVLTQRVTQFSSCVTPLPTSTGVKALPSPRVPGGYLDTI